MRENYRLIDKQPNSINLTRISRARFLVLVVARAGYAHR